MPKDPTLDFALLEAGPDLDVIARNITKAKRKLKRPTPPTTDLATAITGLSINDTIQGSSTLRITVLDEDYALLDSGFFDADKDGRLDAIDLNYPDGSRLWWRLTQCNPRSTHLIEMVFMERAAAHMMTHKGPLKISRAKRTRAQFLKMLTGRVKGEPITFVSTDLKVTQPIGTAKDRKPPKPSKTDKDPGINPGEPIVITGPDGGKHILTTGELANAERVLATAHSHDAPEKAVLALCEACIVEAPFFANPVGGEGTSSGILQLIDSHLGGSTSTDGGRRDIELVCKMFLVDGFAHGIGAIAYANAHTDWSAGTIAQAVQGSGFPDRYDKVEEGAKAVIEAGGGGGFSGTSYRKQYNFEVGKDENFWDAANRLGNEELDGWAFFLDGQYAYYDPETTLIKQKVAAVIRRDDPTVVSWDCDWDSRHIATEFRLDLICEPFEFRAGEVFKLNGFGPASTGSTAKLPGRWLISDVDRERSNVYSSFTLKQPTAAEPEPLSEIGTRRPDAAEAGGDITGTPKDIIDNVVLPIARELGFQVTPNSVEAANRGHTHLGDASDHAGWKQGGLTRYAADISDGVLTEGEKKLTQALCDKFDIPYSMPILASATHDGIRYQIIHGANFPPPTGDHTNHVHFGAKVV